MKEKFTKYAVFWIREYLIFILYVGNFLAKVVFSWDILSVVKRDSLAVQCPSTVVFYDVFYLVVLCGVLYVIQVQSQKTRGFTCTGNNNASHVYVP